MNREIKFRAWDTVNKRFANASTYCRDDGQFLASADPNGVDMSGKQCVRAGKQYIFAGQFTGLKDKNGKEIYEGDILEVGESKLRYTVAYSTEDEHGEKIAAFTIHLKEFKEAFAIDDYAIEHGTVIGNIYETTNQKEE